MKKETPREKFIKIGSYILLTVVPAIFAVMIAIFTFGGDVREQVHLVKENTDNISKLSSLVDKIGSSIIIHDQKINYLEDVTKKHQIKIENVEQLIKNIDLNLIKINTTLELQQITVNRFWEKDWKNLQNQIDKIENRVTRDK
jgi:hypothetical protein